MASRMFEVFRWTVSLSAVAGLIGGTLAVKEWSQPEPPEPTVVAKTEAQADYIAVDQLDNFRDFPGGSQMTLVKLRTGEHVGSATERFPRPALSLAKLYLADYVFEHGDDNDRDKAREMIERSSDSLAYELIEKYPEAISATAREYGLWSTRAGETWGLSTTSTYDVVKFVQAKLEQDPTSPVLEAMKASAAIAADGYGQDYGTAKLPGAQGTKWGWSNWYDLHSSVTFGEDFVAAAAVYGSASDLTALVKRYMEPELMR
ncbi:hypothetical protein [Corynebacterium hindlerae]|uniref:hypothetical protein n=1 Tax=Corynebacterium hindlerae TaxID=699041 RepID=UPI001FCABFB0|nr:hypothetical protein [Corynebacterium hindlerae]